MGATISTFTSCQNLNIETITDINEIVRCVKPVNGLLGQAASSASPTDVYIIDFNNVAKYNNETIEKGFMKVFLTKIKEDLINTASANPQKYIDLPDKVFKASYRVERKLPITGTILQEAVPNYNIDNLNAQIVLYEYYIYKLKISPLIMFNICPHFVKFLGGETAVSGNSLINFITDKTYKTKSQVESNFIRNLKVLVYSSITHDDSEEKGLGERPSITDDSKTIKDYKGNVIDISGLYNNEFCNKDNYKYGFILNEAVKVASGVRALGESLTLTDFLYKEINYLDEKSLINIYTILFQQFLACYAMSLAGMNHNDLHGGNSWIKKINKRLITYYIEDEKYTLETDNFVMVYDFDRAYVTDFDNPYLKDGGLDFANSNNKFREKIDLLKTIANVSIILDYQKNRFINKAVSNPLYNTAVRNIETFLKTLDDIIYVNPAIKGYWPKRLLHGWLQYEDAAGLAIDEIRNNEYTLINNYTTIFRNLFTNLQFNRNRLGLPGIPTTIPSGPNSDLYIISKDMFNKDYIDPKRYETVISKIIRLEKIALQNKVNALTTQSTNDSIKITNLENDLINKNNQITTLQNNLNDVTRDKTIVDNLLINLTNAKDTLENEYKELLNKYNVEVGNKDIINVLKKEIDTKEKEYTKAIKNLEKEIVSKQKEVDKCKITESKLEQQQEFIKKLKEGLDRSTIFENKYNEIIEVKNQLDGKIQTLEKEVDELSKSLKDQQLINTLLARECRGIKKLKLEEEKTQGPLGMTQGPLGMTQGPLGMTQGPSISKKRRLPTLEDLTSYEE